ncbi:MAG: cellulase family glycosylhydrolase [Ruminococcus sp.]|nr:cellulase family glycosylhydrolase [Ruminococcus sp.]
MRTIQGYTHGINLGGWLSQNDDTSKKHYNNFITEKDIKYIASLGLDHVRIPIDYMLLEEEDGTEKQEGYYYLNKCIEWCKKYNIHIIIDLHKTYGYSFDPLDKTDKKIFFYNKKIQERFYTLWKRIAVRYKGLSYMVAFELLNEIVEPEVAEEWNKIALNAIHEIHKIAPDTWIIFGGTMYNSVLSVPSLAVPDDKKVAFTFHSYEPIIFTHQGAYWVDNMNPDFRISYPESLSKYRNCSKNLKYQLVSSIFRKDLTSLGTDFFEKLFLPAIKYAEENNVPIYCGEYGVIDLADDISKVKWVKDICTIFNKYQIGRAYWNYKEKDYGIVNIENEEIKKQLAENF